MRTLVKMNFDPDIAKDVGTDAAIIFENICYWIEKNRLNERHFYDGDWWTYNSMPAFTGLFVWLTERQVRHNLDKLREKGYLKIGKYNKHAYDQTLWYALGDNDACLQICKMYRTNLSDGYDKNARPIPNSKPNYKQGEDTPTVIEEKQVYDWQKFLFEEQIKLLRSILHIENLTDVDVLSLIDRLKKSGGKNKLETAYRWLYADVVSGKLIGQYWDFTSSGGGVVNNMPDTFEKAEKAMQSRLDEIEKQKPGFIKSMQVETPAYDF